MIVKVGNNFIPGTVSIQLERKAKTFENIADIDGDFSYAFDLDDTAETRAILGIRDINQINKGIYTKTDAELLSDMGISLYFGFVRVERVTGVIIRCSFFSGNSNWIDALRIDLQGLDYSKFDTELDPGPSNFDNTTGVVFPVVDRGLLSTRVSVYLNDEDFQPFIFVKNIFEVIATSTGIKFTGDLFADSRFSRLITTNNGLSGARADAEDRAVYIGSPGGQFLSSLTFTKVLFTVESGGFSDSTVGNWNAAQSHYVCDIGLSKFRVEFNIKFDDEDFFIWRVVRNGSVIIFDSGKFTDGTDAISDNIVLSVNASPGDTIELQVEALALLATVGIEATSWIRITPLKFSSIRVASLVPDISCLEFVSQIFKIFNVVPAYDPWTKTVDTVLFKNLVKRTPIDLSQYIESYEYDFVEMQDNYSQANYMKYTQQDNPNITTYNDSNTLGYGNGSFDISNEFLNKDSTLFELDFVAPEQRAIPSMGTSLPYLNYVEFEDTDETRDITSVTDASGFAQFNWTVGGSILPVGTYVRIDNSTVSAYNGVIGAVVSLLPMAVILSGVPYSGDATADLTVLEYSDIDNDEQVLLLYQEDTDVSEWSGQSSIPIPSVQTSTSFAYFYFPNLNLEFNDGPRRQALYFSKPNDINTLQSALIDDYYAECRVILNDPVKPICQMRLPEKIFLQIDFLSPARVRTKDFDGLFLLNLITGYEGSHLSCTVELIRI